MVSISFHIWWLVYVHDTEWQPLWSFICHVWTQIDDAITNQAFAALSFIETIGLKSGDDNDSI